MKELEKEMSLMAKAMGNKARRRTSASELNMGDLLDDYSDKLAQMVQEKVNLGAMRTDRSEMTEKADDRSDPMDNTGNENTNPKSKA